MTRSKMIKDLVIYLYQNRNEPLYSASFAAHLLNFMEKQGMLPPAYLYEDDFTGNGKMLQTEANEWEDE